jgi:carbon-monoxide dehydrogenase large subunit
MKVVHLEMESPTTLGGFRGMGEGGTVVRQRPSPTRLPTRSRRFGIDINELPVTPERLFRLIEAARTSGKQ